MIEFNYDAACAAVADEVVPDVEVVPEVVAVHSSDFRNHSDEQLEDEINRYKKYIQQVHSAELHLKDTTRLQYRLDALECERLRRKTKGAVGHQKSLASVLQQISGKRRIDSELNGPTNEIGISSKERRTEQNAEVPAFQEELKFQRRGKQTVLSDLAKDSANRDTKPETVSEVKPEAMSRDSRTPKHSNAGKTMGTSPDTVVLCSSDEESLEDNKRPSPHAVCTRRTSLRIAERRRMDRNQKIAYPSRENADAVEVHYRDLRHLDPMEYLNDTVIDFYIKYLQRPEVLDNDRKENFYFFNSFFYKKLTEAFDTEGKQQQTEAFSRLRKWTKRISLFDKSYLILPINDRLHWSLAIICFSVSSDERLLVPHIFHLDSLETGHPSRDIFNCLKSYLKVELDQTEAPTRVKLKDTIIKRAEVPRQENEFDCGLFLLYYIEVFVKTAPLPCKLTETTSLFGKRWFRPAEASSLRSTIRDILEKLFDDELKNGS